MTPEELAEIKGVLERRSDLWVKRPWIDYLHDSVDSTYPPVRHGEVAALVAEVERCWEGLRTGAAERDRLRERVARLERTIEELSRLAADDTVSDAYVRGWVLGGDR